MDEYPMLDIHARSRLMTSITSWVDMDHSEHGMHAPSMDEESLGDRIRRLREDRGIQQVDLAEAAGVRPHTMWRYEAGQSRPGADKLDKIAEALGVTARYLLRGTEPESPEPPEPHLEPVEDEELSVADQALRAMRGAHRLDPETTQRLRERLEHVQFSTGARLSTVVSFLEDELIAMKAERRPKVESEPPPEPPKKSKLTPREPRRGGGRK